MTAPRDPDLLIRAFLDEGRAELPDRAYDAVRDRIDQTRQRVVIGPWRESQMSNFAKIAIAAAAVIAVVVSGINLIPGRSGGGIGGPGAAPSLTPAPTPTPSPTPASTPTPKPLGATDVGTRLAGSYQVIDPFPVPFSVRLDGYQLEELSQGGVSFSLPGSLPSFGVYVPDGTHADPCKADSSPRPVPMTVDGLVGAWDSMRGFKVESATDVTIDGHAGKAVVLSNTVIQDPPCRFGRDWVTIFTYAGGPPRGAATNPGLTQYLWVVDVGGRPVVIDPGTQASNFDELDPVVQSLDFVQ
jgi:hypothetical protein